LECAVTGVEDSKRGMAIKATIVLSAGYEKRDRNEMEVELSTFAKENTAMYKCPRIFEFVDELPKTISGKIRRVQIRETIMSHLQKEEVLFGRGIKCLSLFFIDEVAKYRTYGEDGEIANQEDVYGDGTGTITFNADGTFTWHEDQSETGTDLVFVPAWDD
jgi:hypothetical protein